MFATYMRMNVDLLIEFRETKVRLLDTDYRDTVVEDVNNNILVLMSKLHHAHYGKVLQNMYPNVKLQDYVRKNYSRILIEHANITTIIGEDLDKGDRCVDYFSNDNREVIRAMYLAKPYFPIIGAYSTKILGLEFLHNLAQKTIFPAEVRISATETVPILTFNLNAEYLIRQ